MSDDLTLLLNLAEETAKQAGDILAARPDGYVHIKALSAGDIKLAADLASEKLIREKLAPTNIPIVGEEEGGDVGLMDRDLLYWVIDPLDGTYNYARGLPFCCVSIGLMRGLEPVLGVIYDFNSHVMYAAQAEGQLKLNGQAHTPRWINDTNTGLILSSLRYDEGEGKMVPADFSDLHGDYNKVRFFGTASLSLAWVASGHAEAYIERRVHLWDIAAGLSLLKAAGGRFELKLGYKKPFQLDCFACGRL